MKRYKDYMDGVTVSDTLHEKLKNLEEPKKRPQPWVKWGAMASAFALIVGIGAWGLSRGAVLNSTNPNLADIGTVEVGREEIGEPDIAIEVPMTLPGETPPKEPFFDYGYGLRDGDTVSYYFLPYIEYGMAKNVSEMALDWGLPLGSTRRDLTQVDIAALFGRENALSDHLTWGGYKLSGWAAWYEDGSLWGAFLNGYKGEQDHFEFAFVTGEQYPPTCIAYPDGVEQELWDLTVIAWGYDGGRGCDRRVQFLYDGCGCRFDVTAADQEQAAMLVSRLVRWVAIEGLELDALTSDGAVLAHPWEADPGWSVGEPNYEDGGNSYPDCPYCADGTVHTHSYDPGASGVDIVETVPPCSAAN